MKKIFQFIGLFTLICFSFFYTEKVVTVLNEQDPIMVEIEKSKMAIMNKNYPLLAIHDHIIFYI